MQTRFQVIALTSLFLFLTEATPLLADAGCVIEDNSLVSFCPVSKPKEPECEVKPKIRSRPVRKVCPPTACESGADQLSCAYLAELPRQPNVLLTTDFLWWATNYGLPVSLLISGNSTGTVNYARVLRTHTKFSPGVRLGLRGNLHYDGWDLQGFWTYYYNTENRSIPAGIGQFSSSIISSYPQLRLTYNAADLELGITRLISRRFAFRPFAGVRGAWLYQLHHQHIDHVGDDGESNIPIKLIEDIWAVGPRLGFNMKWDCKAGIHILANLSGSLLYGVSKGKFVGAIPTDSSALGLDIGRGIIFKDRDTELFGNFQTFLGIDWERKFNCDKNSFKIAAGWESNYWAAYNLLLIFNPSLSFQGLTVDMVWGF